MRPSKRPGVPLIAACFDLDGTLVDTGPLHREAERMALSSLGIPELDADHPVTFGTGVIPGIRQLAEHYGFDSVQRVSDAYLAAWESAFERGLQPMQGADEVLRLLDGDSVPLALVTSGEREYVDAVLARFGWTALFDHLVTLESVSNLKPDPEPYMLAAQMLGVEPGRCAGFEDSAPGLQALHSAVMYTVAVGARTGEEKELHGADLEIPGFDADSRSIVRGLFRR